MTCDSCGADDHTLWPVRRAYLLAAADAGPELADGERRIVPGVEQWCCSCITQYPHEPVE